MPKASVKFSNNKIGIINFSSEFTATNLEIWSLRSGFKCIKPHVMPLLPFKVTTVTLFFQLALINRDIRDHGPSGYLPTGSLNTCKYH